MKYSFNEKELLDLFVSNDDSRPLFILTSSMRTPKII